MKWKLFKLFLAVMFLFWGTQFALESVAVGGSHLHHIAASTCCLWLYTLAVLTIISIPRK